MHSNVFILGFISVARCFFGACICWGQWGLPTASSMWGVCCRSTQPSECWRCEQNPFTKASWSPCFASDLMTVSLSFKFLADHMHGKVVCCYLVSTHPEDDSVLLNYFL